LNPHESHPISLLSLGKSFWEHRQLIKQMAWREVVGRYKGSILGLLWSFITPILMLVVYTFIFSVVFKARWSIGTEDNKFSFALILFVGLIVHGLLAEVLVRSPNLILGNVNYVKKVVFPLEILPATCLIAALFHCTMSLAVLLVAFFIVNGYLPWTIFYIPLILLPLAILILGLSWIIASVGVFIRDIGQAVIIITTIMLFLSTVFFPLSALPEKYHIFILLNPITFIIEQAREVLIFGNQPNWSGLCAYLIVAVLVAWIGYTWFQKIRKGFADVV